MTKKFALLFVVAMLLLGVTSCANTESHMTYDFHKSEGAVYEINSKHCPPFFPAKWKNHVKTEVYEDETMYKVSFYAVLGSEPLPLYSFIFGSSPEGYLLGTVKPMWATKMFT